VEKKKSTISNSSLNERRHEDVMDSVRTNTRRVPLVLTLGRKFNSSLRVLRWRFFYAPSHSLVLKALNFRRFAGRRAEVAAKSTSTTRISDTGQKTRCTHTHTHASIHFPSRAVLNQLKSLFCGLFVRDVNPREARLIITVIAAPTYRIPIQFQYRIIHSTR